MPMLHIHLDGEGSLQQVAQQSNGMILQVDDDLHVTALRNGLVSGKPSVAFGFLLPDGRMVFAQTTLALFLMAADSFKARYGDPRHG